MTTRDYNTKFYPRYSAAICALGSIPNTLAKCENPENVKYQFSCSGWNENTINFLEEAVSYYKESIKEKTIKETIGCNLIYYKET